MNRTVEWHDVVNNAGGFDPNRKGLMMMSPVLLRCAEIRLQISAFNSLLNSIFESFVGYHACLIGTNTVSFETKDEGKSSIEGVMTETERSELNTEIAHFIATVGVELKDMRRVGSESGMKSMASKSHLHEVQGQISADLIALTKRYQTMHRERSRLSTYSSPFSFYGTDNVAFEDEALGFGSAVENGAGGLLQRMASASSTSKEATCAEGMAGSDKERCIESSSGKVEARDVQPLGADFAVRYEGQIAPAAQLREYESLTHQHKAALLKESRLMHVRYSEELQNARKMESSVNAVGGLMTEFANILSEQSESLLEVHTEGKEATAHVKQSADELQLTIDRSESHGNNIVMLSVGLALLLVLLDYVTP